MWHVKIKTGAALNSYISDNTTSTNENVSVSLTYSVLGLGHSFYGLNF